MNIFAFLDRNGIKYNNKHLIQQAFIHTSYVNEHHGEYRDNERLEFMGDAVLQIYSSTKLFEVKPELNEGEMSTRRSNLVCEGALAGVAREFRLNNYLMLGVGEEKNGGRNRDSILGDMVEAFIGAIYVDTDFDNAWKLMELLFAKHFAETKKTVVDYKTRLQEYVQTDSRKTIEYETLSVTGPSNNPVFEIAVKVDGLVFGVGKGSSKKEAQKMAAKDALEKVAG